ncbi:MAG: acylphosphatase [Bacteroidetes bacterium]|nr:MAG: acylphosphatase [Bacteroidota bacterium]
MKHYDIEVFGNVQGVWYRKSALNKARELGLRGFVRNRPDGSVYLEAEGPAEQLTALVEWCKEGPPLARVQQVKVRPGNIQGFEQFEIKR